MESTVDSKMLEAREKLRQQVPTRIGGKGSTRMKVRVPAKPVVQTSLEEKRLQVALKKAQLGQLQKVDEVYMHCDDGTSLLFKRPRVQVSNGAGISVIYGSPETVKTPIAAADAQGMLNLLKSSLLASKKGGIEDSDYIPDLVMPTKNFDAPNEPEGEAVKLD